MRNIFIIIGLVLVAINSHSNTGEFYLSCKKGIAIITIDSYQDSAEIQRVQDSYLDFIINRFQRRKSEPKVILLLAPFGIHTPKKNFISISYDYLSKPDTIFVSEEVIDSYRNTHPPLAFKGQHWILNNDYPDDIIGPLIDKQGTARGIIIRYYGEFDSTVNYFDRLSSLINFAFINLEEIKQKQSYIRMPGHFEGHSLSILTYDTSVLNSIPATKYGFDPSVSSADKDDWIVVIVLIIVLGAFTGIYWKLRRTRLTQR